MDRNTKTLVFAVLVGASFMLAFVIFAIPSKYFYVSFVLAIIALALDIVAFSTKYYSYLILPLLHMKGGTVVIDPDEAFYLSPTGKAIVIRGENEVKASAFVKIPIYMSATEMSDDQKLNFAKMFSRVVTLSRYPVKLTSQLYVINKDEYIGAISKKLNEAEERYNALNSDKSTSSAMLNRVNGEVTMWHNLFDSVSKAHSNAQLAYAMVSSVGGNEEEAVNSALQRAEELAAGIGAVLGVVATVAEGQEMLSFVEPDYMIPPTTVTEMMKRELGS